MPVIEGPSIWDYIAQASGKAIDTYQQAKDKTRGDAAANAGFLTQLYGTGAINSDQLQPAVNAVPGMEKVKVQPSKSEKASTPGTPEHSAEQAQQSTNDLQTQVADITTRWSKGETISENEAKIAHLPTSLEVAQTRAAVEDPILERYGTQYVDAEVLKKGGTLLPVDAMNIAGKAYQQFVQDYHDNNLGTLSPAGLANAQRYFTGRAMQILVKQQELANQNLAAQNRGLYGQQPIDRRMGQLTDLLENNRKTLNDFMDANPGAETWESMYKSIDKAPLALRGKIVRYGWLKTREADLENAQSLLASGVMPANYAKLLAAKQPGAGFDAGKVANGVQFIQTGKGKISDLATQVKLGRITQDEADEIQRRVLGATTKPAAKPAAK